MEKRLTEFQCHIIVAIGIALLVALSLGVSLQGDFVWDDRPLIVENLRVKDPAAWSSILTSSFWDTSDRHDRFRSFYRPVIGLSYALDHTIWGLSPFGYHLTNLLLHFLCCWLVHRLALSEGLGIPAAAVGAALFAVHPVHVESVAWISGRTDLLCAFFTLAAFAAYRRNLRDPRPRWRILALSAFALALLSKEMAATLAALVGLDCWLRCHGREKRWRPAVVEAIPFMAVLGGYLLLRAYVLDAGGDPLFSLDPTGFLATASFVMARYAILLIMPVGLDAHYPYTALESLGNPIVLVSIAILVVIFVVARRLAGATPRALFWVAWIFVGLAPVLAFGRFGDVLLADRFLYIPSVGLALLLARASSTLFAGTRSTGSRVALATVLAATVLGLGLLSAKRSSVWRDDYRLFSDMARTSPHSALVQCNLGLALYRRGEMREARQAFERALELEPGYAMAHNNLAAALEREGRLDEALAHYQRALELAPAQVEARLNAGHLLVRLNRPAPGLELLQSTSRRLPGNAEALFKLAEAQRRVGQLTEAARNIEQACRLDRNHAGAHYLLGQIRFEQKRYAEAVSAMERFLELYSRKDRFHDAAIDLASRATIRARETRPLPP